MVGVTETVFSWSLEDIFNEDLYKNKVEKIPESFQSVDQYFGSYLYPLLEETRAQLQSSMETIDSAPFAEVVDFEESKRYGSKQYRIKVNFWRNRFSDRGKEPYKTLPGDLFILANAKPETVSELELTGRSWSFASVTHLVSSISQIPETDQNGDVEDVEEGTSLCFKIVSSKEFEVDDCRSLFVVFLLNLIPSARICNALQMSGNLKIIKEVLCPDSVAQENLSYNKNNDIMEKGLDDNLLSGLNEAQSRAVLACLGMLHHDAKSSVELIWGPPGTGKTKTIATLLFTLLKRHCRTLVCAPTNVAITEVAARLLKLVTEEQSSAMFCSLGEILLFGNKERLKPKVGSDIEDIYLGHRIQRLIECLGPQTGWRHWFASMINFLEDCVCQYNSYLGNELSQLTKEREQNSGYEMNDVCRSGTEVSKRKCKTFVDYFRDTFVSTATPLKYCISIFCTHISEGCISEHISSAMVSFMEKARVRWRF